MLTFDERTHTYTVDGVPLPSVTEVTRFLAYDYKSDRPWLAEQAARRGTAVHEACALIDYGETPEETPEFAGYLTAYRRFLHDYKPDWELIEFPMGSLDLGYAGTMDRCGMIDGERCVLDIKTGQLHYTAVSAQLTAYAMLYKLSPHCSDLYGGLKVLKLSKDGTYILRSCSPCPGVLEACMILHNATERKKRA